MRLFFFLLLFPVVANAGNFFAGKSITASNYSDGYEPRKSIDGDVETMWRSNLPVYANATWLHVDNGSGVVLSSYSLTSNAIYAGLWDPTAWVLFGSVDDNVWETLDARYDATPWTAGETRWYTVTSTGTYQYYRLTIDAVTSSGCDCWIAEWDAIGAAGGSSTTTALGTEVSLVSVSSDVVAALTPGILKEFTGGDLSFWFGVLVGFAVIFGFKAGGL